MICCWNWIQLCSVVMMSQLLLLHFTQSELNQMQICCVLLVLVLHSDCSTASSSSSSCSSSSRCAVPVAAVVVVRLLVHGGTAVNLWSVSVCHRKNDPAAGARAAEEAASRSFCDLVEQRTSAALCSTCCCSTRFHTEAVNEEVKSLLTSRLLFQRVVSRLSFKPQSKIRINLKQTK